MKILAIIRTFEAELKNALQCAKSIERFNVADEIHYFAQEGDYKIDVPYPVHMRGDAGNMGGLGRVKVFWADMKHSFSNVDFDYIMMIDSDITFLKDFRHEFDGTDHMGIMDAAGRLNEDVKHISGQCQIFSKRAWDRIINYHSIDWASDYIIRNEYSVADDTIFSVMVQEGSGYTVKDLNCKGYWIHDKFYEDISKD